MQLHSASLAWESVTPLRSGPPKTLHIVRRADGDDVLCRCRECQWFGSRFRRHVARCENDDHLLVAVHDVGGIGGLRVAHERVVMLRLGIVNALRIFFPPQLLLLTRAPLLYASD